MNPPTRRSLHETLEWAVGRTGARLPAPVFRAAPKIDDANAAGEAAAVLGEHAKTSSRALAIVATLACFYTLYFARDVVLPVVMAVLLSFLLRSTVRWLKRRGIREPIGAALVVLGLVCAMTATVVFLAAPAQAWLARAPDALTKVDEKARALVAPLTRWQRQRAPAIVTPVISNARANRARATVDSAQRIVDSTLVPISVDTPMLRRAFGGVSGVALFLTTVIFLAYFLLASGDLFMRKLLRVLPRDALDGSSPVAVSDEVESAVSRYLLTATLINIGFGIATWAVLLMLGMPNPGLWGGIAAVLNFVPYLGALLTLVVLAAASFAVFDSVSQAMIVPLAFVVLNLIESNVVTPLLMGKQFPLNTPALFVGILFWQFMFGVPGAIMAVPIMVSIKILCDAIPALRPYGEFLGP